jgi:hypothetical protein
MKHCTISVTCLALNFVKIFVKQTILIGKKVS